MFPNHRKAGGPFTTPEVRDVPRSVVSSGTRGFLALCDVFVWSSSGRATAQRASYQMTVRVHLIFDAAVFVNRLTIHPTISAVVASDWYFTSPDSRGGILLRAVVRFAATDGMNNADTVQISKIVYSQINVDFVDWIAIRHRGPRVLPNH